MSGAPLPWHGALWSRMTAAGAAGRLGAALLFAGPRGVGKRAFAAELAAFLLCEGQGDKPCGACRGCVQLQAGSHPNAWLLEPQGLYGMARTASLRQPEGLAHWVPEDVRKDPDKAKRDIAIDGVRELIGRLQLSSHYGGRKIAVFAPADALTGASANALLKTVEEPPAGTHLVLVAERWRALPATLRSRCQIVRFAPPRPEQALAWLTREHPGRPEVALRPYRSAPLLAGADDAAAQDEQWSGALAELAAGRMQALARAAGAKRDDAQRVLEAMLRVGTRWLRALLVPESGAAPPRGVAVAPVQQLLSEAIEGLRALERNASPALLLESIMIRWAGASRALR